MSEKAPISTSMRSEADQLAFIWKTVESIATCMMTTSDGPLLRSRPMRGYIRAKENAIYFITSRSTHKPDEIAAKPHVGLSFVDNASNTFISLSGPIVMIDDRHALDTLWSRADDAYFPGGSGDPDVMLLTFTPELLVVVNVYVSLYAGIMLPVHCTEKLVAATPAKSA